MCEEITELKKIHKILWTFVFLLIAVSCYFLMPYRHSQTTTRTTTDPSGGQWTEQFVEQSPSVSRLIEWLAIGAAAFAIWPWRRELGIARLGPFGGLEAITQQKGGEPAKQPEDSGPPPRLDLDVVKSEMVSAETKQRLEHIMQMFQKSHSVNVSQVARELEISMNTAKTYLYILTKAGQLRADGFPRHTIYTPAHSIENRILNAAAQQLAKTHGVLSERRFVRVKRTYEVDALLESDDMTFVVEAKVLRSPDIVARLDLWVLQLLTVAKELPSKKVACVLAVACIGEVDADEVRKQLAGLTFDSCGVRMQVHVFSETELPK
jgi:hypothetical protein